MSDYLALLAEYKQTETSLRERIAEISDEISDEMEKPHQNMEMGALRKRRCVLNQELYDLLGVMDKLCDYADCGVEERAETFKR